MEREKNRQTHGQTTVNTLPLTTAIGVGKNLLTYLLFGAVEYRTAIYVTLQGQQHGGSAVQWAGGVQLCVVVVNILSVY